MHVQLCNVHPAEVDVNIWQRSIWKIAAETLKEKSSLLPYIDTFSHGV